MSASPVELTAIVYEYALAMTRDARRFLASREIAARSKAISRALAAISELEMTLDHRAGGEISVNFARLYQYMRVRLSTANTNQEDGPLAEVEELLTVMLESWSTLRTSEQASAHQPQVAPPQPATTDWGAPFIAQMQPELASHGWSA